jgi:MFS family permease
VRSNAPMRTQIGTLIIATSLVQLANGFFGTFIALRVAIEDFGAGLAGLVLSSYFAGFTVGALRCGRIIERVGHIRAYAAFGGLVAAATAAMPLLVKPLPWLALRAVIGFGCAGLFVTTESWLNAKALPQERGRVFSIYMVGTFAALAAGQLLIAGARVAAAAPFNVMVVLFAVALVMVSTTRAEPPRIAPGPMLPAGQLARAAPIAVVGSALSGLIAGTFYTLVPAYLQGAGIDRATIAQVMFAAVLGGLAFQVPIGRLSDRFDRRRVLAGLGVGLAGTALALIFVPRTLATVLPPAALLGGFLSTVYPVCVAHAHDCMPADRVVAVSERLILVSGVGSVLGPLVGSEIMAHLGINGVIYFMAAGALIRNAHSTS